LLLAIGADQVAELDKSKAPEEIARLDTILAFARSGHPLLESPR